ncbi:MAG: hypothetical protein WBF90_22535 [Rivularia sp. (in: cyanobacteria)]
MSKNIKYWISGLLILSSVLLVSLVPGGSIETRDFSHINPIILGTFNTFLTVLGIGSLLLIYFVFQEAKWTYLVATVFGISYFLVYVLDLGAVFPVSSDPMPTALFVIEIIGAVVSLPLTFLCVNQFLKFNRDLTDTKLKPVYSPKFFYIAMLSIFLGCGIITFATISAMGI